MRLAFILNPAARNGRAGRVRKDIESALARRGVEATIVETTARRHATSIAASLAGQFEAIVAVGGDGTAHEVAEGLHGTNAALGVLPEGTGNDFAHALGMPDDVNAAVDAILDSPVKPVDLGRVRWTEVVDDGTVSREELFVNCLGVGFDGLVATLVPRYKWMGGNTAYLAGVFRALSLWKKPGVEVSVDGAPLYSGPLYFISVCNGYSIGGGFLMTPDAVPDDGVLDLCLVRGMPVLRVLQLLPLTFKGKHVGAKEVIMGRLKSLSAVPAAPLPMQADGEVITTGALTVDVDVLPAALRAITPGRH